MDNVELLIRQNAERQQQDIQRQAEEQRRRIQQQQDEAYRELEAQAEAENARIRQLYGSSERSRQSALQSAREAQRKEQRKQDLPYTKPSDIGVKEYIEKVETTHAGNVASIEAAKQSIKEQKEKIKADIARQSKEAREKLDSEVNEAINLINKSADDSIKEYKAELEKYVQLNTGEYVDKNEFNKLDDKSQKLLKENGVDKFNQIQQQQANMSGIDVFKQLQSEGKIPANASYKSYDPSTGTVNYEVETVIEQEIDGKQAFDELVKNNEIPSNAIYKGFDKSTKQIHYEVPVENPVIEQVQAINAPALTPMDEFKQLQKENKIPENALFAGRDQQGNISYIIPTDYNKLEAEFRSESKARQNELLKSYGFLGTEITNLFPIVQFNMLKEADKQAFLDYYYSKQGKEITFQEYIKPTAEFGISMIPVVSTAYFWNDMSTGWKAASIVMDVLSVLPGAGAIVRSVKLKPVMTIAREAGTASKTMEKAVSTMRATEFTAKNYSSIAAKAQTAIQASKVADAKFIKTIQNINNANIKALKTIANAAPTTSKAKIADKINKIYSNVLNDTGIRITSLKASEIAKLEKLSGYKGISASINNVNVSVANLNKAWKLVDKQKVGTEGYIKALDNVETARNNLNKALTDYSKVTEARVKPTPAAGYEPIIEQIEKSIKNLKDEIESLLAKRKKEGLESKKAELHNEYLEAKQKLDSEVDKLEMIKSARDNGIPAPEIKRYLVKWENKAPSKDDLANLWNMFQKPKEPSTGSKTTLKQLPTKEADGTQLQLIQDTKPKVAVAVTDKPIEVKVTQTIELKPEYKEVTETRKVDARVKDVPKISKDTKVSLITPRKTGSKSSSSTQSDTDLINAVSNNRIVDNKIITITNNAIKIGASSLVKGATYSITKGKVEDSVNRQIRNITDHKLREAIKLKAKEITKTALKVATELKAKTNIKVVEKPAIRETGKIKLPTVVLANGKLHTLSQSELDGAVGWKQGFIYKGIFPPYKQQNVFNSRKQIEGIKYYDGAGSAFKSLTLIKGTRLPSDIALTMGIVSFRITSGSKPTIKFKKRNRKSGKSYASYAQVRSMR